MFKYDGSVKQVPRPSQDNVPEWGLQEFLLTRKSVPQGATVLDVGAGLSPYRNLLEQNGFKYYSHDFGGYAPDLGQSGFQELSWNYPQHDFECDILDLPESHKFDLVICTEVFEHIPDPISALEKISNLLKPSGQVYVTVPAMSFKHQAPYYFQSGLSTYWFEYWAPRKNLNILDIIEVGNYEDYIESQFAKILEHMPSTLLTLNYPENLVVRYLKKYLKNFIRRAVSKLTAADISSSPSNVLFVGENQNELQ